MKKIGLRQHFEKILKEKEKALNAALIAVKEENRKTEIAAEKRFELLNELRSGVATSEQVAALEKIVLDLKSRIDTSSGKNKGVAEFFGWITAGVAIIAFIIEHFKK